MTHVTSRLTAKNRDQLRNPTLGNRVWATFTFYCDNAKSVSNTGRAKSQSPILLYFSNVSTDKPMSQTFRLYA